MVAGRSPCFDAVSFGGWQSDAFPSGTLFRAFSASKALHRGSGPGADVSPTGSFALFETAAKHNVPCHVHARYKGNIFPETMSLAVMEVISMAAATGAQAELVHLTSSTVGSAPLTIRLIEGAARNGVKVGFNLHVWTRNETSLQSALYDPGWQERFGGISYEQIYVADTQEQLSKSRFEELRKQKDPVQVQTEFIKNEEIEMALRSSLGVVTSDGGGLDDGKGHPRSVGTFARFLRVYVRENKVLPLMEALKRKRSCRLSASKGRCRA